MITTHVDDNKLTAILGSSSSPVSIIPFLLLSCQIVSPILPATTCTNTSFEITGKLISGTLAENELVYMSPELFPVGVKVILMFLRNAHAITELDRIFHLIAVTPIILDTDAGENEVHVAAEFGLDASLTSNDGEVVVYSHPYSPFAPLRSDTI